MLPVIQQLCKENEQLSLSVLAWALSFGACFGGNGTIIGASANIVTATLAEKRGHALGFMTWLKAGVPVTIASVAVAHAYMLLRFCT
jgi:Na+/H+ antiporter NhaD/arsenite permease-like protein